MELDVKINKERGRFEVPVENELAVADYKLTDNTMVFTHTWVPRELRGQGIGKELVRQALEYARSHDYRVKGKCPFVKSYLDNHSEFSGIIANGS